MLRTVCFRKIAQRMREKLQLSGHSVENVDAKGVIARWQSGDPAATELMNETFGSMALAIASFIHIFNPEFGSWLLAAALLKQVICCLKGLGKK